MSRRRKFWGWGYEDEDLGPEERAALAGLLAERLGVAGLPVSEPPTLAEIELRAPRVKPPSSLDHLCSDSKEERASHTYGKSFRDVVRAYRRDFSNPPDLVAAPNDEEDVRRILDWCSEEGLAAIPYGGGSSVVGGVEPPPADAFRGVVTIDLRNLNRVVEVDRASRAARIQGGALGPDLEAQLKPHGYTLRHFPQSFELSTLGGWIATRSGGHFATLYTHIDDFVEAIRVVTPAGLMKTRRLPGSGAGPQPERLFLGSEGSLGIITEAWMRLQDRPTFRANVASSFARFEDAVAACRAVSQSGLHPSNCRLLDPLEALYSGAGDGSETLLLIAFESADHPLDAWISRAAQLCRDHGGEVPEEVGTRAGTEGAREGSAGAWRDAFIKMPYRRDAIAGMGVINETFETACTWDAFPRFHAAITGAVQAAIGSLEGPTAGVAGKGWVSTRFTHVYPDGPAPYYSIMALGTPGQEIEEWQVIKDAASNAILREGGTITHHHAVGRDHMPWYDEEKPALFDAALRAAKSVLDPRGVMNPGVILKLP